jgi:acetyl esterase/lipase
MKMKFICLLICFIVTGSILRAQETVKLYAGKAPGSENWTQKEAEMYSDLFKTEVVYNVTDPSLLVFKPAKDIKNTGTAIVIAPGGGFQSLSINREGTELAKILSDKGITAFVLKYRLNKTESNDPAKEMMDKLKDRAAFEKNTVPMIRLAAQDGKTALKYVHDNASKYGIDLHKIGVIGFSAGSTVAMETVLNNTPEQLPAFAASLYGGPSEQLLAAPVPSKKIPLFVCVASDDQLKLAPRSILLYNKWLEAGQSVELHMYAKGGHGFGTGKQNLPVDSWVDRFEEWLQFQGFLN